MTSSTAIDGNSLLEAADNFDATELLHQLGCTDGLPVIVPTPERVEAMVLATGIDGDLSIGSMGPGGGAATIRTIAANAVMAGCIPDLMPFVLASVRAVLDPRFDLGEMQGTTHCTAPLIIANGPLSETCGIASGFGALGPGFRSNATIGRALRLCMMNIGGARPGTSDMALLGHPGKFTFCLAENEADSPLEPLHLRWGYKAEDTVVTVVGAEPPHSVLFVSGDDADSPDRLLRVLAATIANVGSNNVNMSAGAVTVVLNIDHANLLHSAGYNKSMIAEKLAEYATQDADHLNRFNPSLGRPKSGVVQALRSPDDVLVLVAGGGGLYSVVMPSWAAGPNRNSAVHARVETDQACQVPWA